MDHNEIMNFKNQISTESKKTVFNFEPIILYQYNYIVFIKSNKCILIKMNLIDLHAHKVIMVVLKFQNTGT